MSRPLHRCSNCGAPSPSGSTTWQHAIRAKGHCVRCNKRKSAADERFWNCAGCRRDIAARARARYARRGRVAA